MAVALGLVVSLLNAVVAVNQMVYHVIVQVILVVVHVVKLIAVAAWYL